MIVVAEVDLVEDVAVALVVDVALAVIAEAEVDLVVDAAEDSVVDAEAALAEVSPIVLLKESTFRSRKRKFLKCKLMYRI